MLRRIAQAIALLGLMGAGCTAPPDESFRQRAVSGSSPNARLVTSQPVGAEGLPQLSADSAISDYLLYAALNNPGLEGAFERWRAAAERPVQMRALPDPQLSYRYFLHKMGSGPDMDMRQSLGISQPLPWPGKLVASAAMADEEAAAELERFEAERLKLFEEVTYAYGEYYYLGRAIAATEENLHLMEYLESVARTRYTVMAGSHPDVIRAQVELGKLGNELATLRDMMSARAARLNAVMNRPVEARLDVPRQIAAAEPTAEEQILLGRLESANPELRAMEHEVAAGDRGVELARQGYLPDFMVGVEWMDMTARPGSTMDAEDNWAFMVGLTLPIWWDKNAAAVREARARLRAAELDRANMSNTLRADLKLAAYEYRDAARRVSLYRDTLLPKAKQSFQTTEAAYRSGTAGFSDLVDSQRMWLEFQLAYERAMADSQQRLAEVHRLIGQAGNITSTQGPVSVTGAAAAVVGE